MSLKDDDQITFLIQYDPEMKNILLQISAPSPLQPEEYIACLMDFVEQYEKNVDDLFENGQDFLVERH